MSYAQTLILNQHYRPHEIENYQNAITRMVTGKLEVIVQYDEILAYMTQQTLKEFPELKKALRNVVGTDVTSFEFKVPAVAVLMRGSRQVKTGVKFSKINVCLRDKFRCQYCGHRFKMSQLNYDHVIPRAQMGKTVWDNIVMACAGPQGCNARKANRTPEQAGMKLLNVPVKPKVLPMNEPMINADEAPAEWLPYLTA